LLAEWVASVWLQQIDPAAAPYVQRNLPHGGMELTCVAGSNPRITGPLSGPTVEVLAPGTTLVGVRFRPGAAPLLGLPGSELVDARLSVADIWGPNPLGERIALARTPVEALDVLQYALVARLAGAAGQDPLIAELVHQLLPWQGSSVGSLHSVLWLSGRQLRRRCRAATGLTPKALQMTLRFQGFLAVAQQVLAAGGLPGDDWLAWVAADLGYADQPHLNRECLRLTGLPARAFLGRAQSTCACGHDHSASFAPILRAGRGLS
jgi:AraC-like DNA-binding protein